MSFEFNRNLVDAEFEKTGTVTVGGATSGIIDLEQIVGGDVEGIACELVLPAQTGLSNASVITFALNDSADGTSFAAVDPAITTTQTGAGGVGAAAKTVRFRLSPATRRYVRIAQTNTATPGTLAGTFTFRLLF